MAFQPLTREQYQKAVSAGFHPDKIIEMEKVRKSKMTAAPAAQPGFLSRVGSDFAQRGQNIVNDYQAAKPTVGNFSGNRLADATLLSARSAGRAAGQIAGGVGDMIGEAAKSVIPQPIQDAVGGAVRSAAQTAPGQAALKLGSKAMSAIPQDIRPDLASVGNVAGLGVGGKAAKTAGSAAADAINGATPTIKKGLEKGFTGMVDRAATKSAAKATKLLQSTEDTLSKGERLAAHEEGRVKVTALGAKDFVPSKTEQRAGQILSGKLSSNPVKNVPIIKSEIASRSRQAEKYLTKNAQKVSAEEQRKMFSDLRTKAEKYLNESELKAYDEQIGMFLKQLPGRGGYNTANFYKGLKEYENNVADRLARGKAALLDPTGVASAKLHAASDVRKAVRDMIGKKHKEFKSKMFDLASLYEVKSTMLTKADQLEGNALSRAAKAVKSNPVGQFVIGGAALFAADKGLKATTGIGY